MTVTFLRKMSWHYYAQPKAPAEPPANIEYLTRLAKPRTVHKTYAQWEKTQTESLSATSSQTQSLRDKPVSKDEEALTARLVAQPKHRAGQRQKYTPPGPDEFHAHDLPPPANEAVLAKLAQPLRTRQKYHIPTYAPPLRQPVDFDMFPRSMPERKLSPARIRTNQMYVLLSCYAPKLHYHGFILTSNLQIRFNSLCSDMFCCSMFCIITSLSLLSCLHHCLDVFKYVFFCLYECVLLGSKMNKSG